MAWLKSPRGFLIGLLGTCFALASISAAFAQSAKPQTNCRPVSQRTEKVGCWIVVEAQVGVLPQGPVFWQLNTYPTRAAAEAAKRPHDTVLESLDKVWLLSLREKGYRPAGGLAVAEIGPLGVNPSAAYTAQYMEAVFPPGYETRPRTHPGPEAWYHEAGEVCLETPNGKASGHVGDGGFIVPGGLPMRLSVTGTVERRSLVLILGETGKPAIAFEKAWVPKGLCD
jgi:hypothetical protein